MSSETPFRRLNKNNPADLRKKIAELPSFYSKPGGRIISMTANLYGAKACLLLVYLCLHFEEFETEELIRKIAHKAYLQNYNGEWKTVQEYLESELQTPKQFEEKYLLDKGPNDFYGNFLPKAVKYMWTLKIKDLTRKDRRPVKKPIPSRGYKDKGSSRLPSEDHGERPCPAERKEDRRGKVSHPYLKEQTDGARNESSEHISTRKEEIFYVPSGKILRNSYISYSISLQAPEYEITSN